MKTAFPYQSILELPTFEYGCLAGLNIKEGEDAEARGTDEQPLFDMMWRDLRYDVEKLAVPGNSNLKAQHKVLC